MLPIVRIATTVAAVVATVGVVVVAVKVASSEKSSTPDSFSMPSSQSRSPRTLANGDPVTATASPTPVTATATPTTSPIATAVPAHVSTATPRPAATKAPAPPAGGSLPLNQSTGSATQVITVMTSSTRSTTASLQAWDKYGSGWVKHGGAVTAHIGSQGMTTSPSEGKSATPIGSFSLTRAFGVYGNPGTGLPYLVTTSADWWISQSGPLYNTLQHCSGSCPFTQGDPNEHLRAITPQYNYAVVIDYNIPQPGQQAIRDAGSAFFLHVTDGTATAGCVAIAQATLVSLMQWLTPSRNPRILIGLG